MTRTAVVAASALLLLSSLGLAGTVARAADDPGKISAVVAGPDGLTFTIMCDADTDYRLVQERDGTLFTVQLPDTEASLDPEALPAPSGQVKAISSGTDAQGANVVFLLRHAAAAVVEPVEGGLQVRFLPLDAREEGATAGPMRPLGTEDLLEVTVFEVPDLNRTVRIAETGSVSLPLIGEVHAAGLTPRELEDQIRTMLEGGYVKHPHVSVFVKEHGSKKVSVLGEVGKPGVYEMLGPRTLLQVLAQAGGLGAEAGSQIFVIRASPGGGNDRIPIDIDGLLTSQDPSANISIEPGDVVSVPRDRMVQIYVDGAVRTPGRIEEKSSREITLMQAIAKAGGGTERANLKKVQILRKGASGTQRSILVNIYAVRKGAEPDQVLQDGDVVIVPETFF